MMVMMMVVILNLTTHTGNPKTDVAILCADQRGDTFNFGKYALCVLVGPMPQAVAMAPVLSKQGKPSITAYNLNNHTWLIVFV
jgi:hypothetical protein